MIGSTPDILRTVSVFKHASRQLQPSRRQIEKREQEDDTVFEEWNRIGTGRDDDDDANAKPEVHANV